MLTALKAILGHNVKVEPTLITQDGEVFTLYGLLTEIKSLRASNKRLTAEVLRLRDYNRAAEETTWKSVKWRKIDVEHA
jgi:hypothetical protein